MDNISNLILQKRKERGLTQSELGAMLGLPVEQKIAESEPPSTFLSTVKSELIRILSAGVMIAVCICNMAGIISTDSTAVSLGFSAALFCFGTMIKG